LRAHGPSGSWSTSPSLGHLRSKWPKSAESLLSPARSSSPSILLTSEGCQLHSNPAEIQRMQENPYAAPTAQPHAPGLIASPGEGPREWTVGQVLGVGWKAVKEQPVPLVGGTLLVTVVQYA